MSDRLSTVTLEVHAHQGLIIEATVTKAIVSCHPPACSLEASSKFTIAQQTAQVHDHMSFL